jgi:heme-degrading monooxygenase HmoA
MAHLVVRAKFEDFARWKPIFDRHGATRKASGSKGGYIFRNTSDPNELIVLFEWDNLENARQFAQSEELRERMQEAGLMDRPDVYFLEQVERFAQ